MVAPGIGALILGFSPWPGVFIALALFALLILLALVRFPESATLSVDDRLTFRRVFRAFGSMLSSRSFLGYQMAGSFSFAALFCYLSTVAYFLPDVFEVPTSLFGYAFALTVFGFMTGSLVNASLVMRYGMGITLRAGLIISLASAAAITLLAPVAKQYMPTLAFLSSTFFFGVGLTAANASMGAISLFRSQAGAASAVYGFTHALLASLVGALAGVLYAGRLLEPALILLTCSLLAISALWLIPGGATT
jgi:DHA1 family bicyclomycin/chloramphenicol resistance-like MFS transporter